MVAAKQHQRRQRRGRGRALALAAAAACLAATPMTAHAGIINSDNSPLCQQNGAMCQQQCPPPKSFLFECNRGTNFSPPTSTCQCVETPSPPPSDGAAIWELVGHSGAAECGGKQFLAECGRVLNVRVQLNEMRAAQGAGAAPAGGMTGGAGMGAALPARDCSAVIQGIATGPASAVLFVPTHGLSALTTRGNDTAFLQLGGDQSQCIAQYRNRIGQAFTLGRMPPPPPVNDTANATTGPSLTLGGAGASSAGQGAARGPAAAALAGAVGAAVAAVLF
jgi:hypothetical protein